MKNKKTLCSHTMSMTIKELLNTSYVYLKNEFKNNFASFHLQIIVICNQ